MRLSIRGFLPELTAIAQYANIYFLRLAGLKPILMHRASEQWSSHATHTERVLDVMQGELTWIIGTIYMDMPLKPQVLQDLVADVNLSAAVPAQAWRDPRRDVIQLEDESGRICIVGNKLLEHTLCTGTVVAVLGSETSSEEFDVIDIIYPGSSKLGPKSLDPEDSFTKDASNCHELDGNEDFDHSKQEADKYIGLVSGLDISGSYASSSMLDLLSEYLTGELLNDTDQRLASRICALIIAGNSLKATSSIPDDAMSRRLSKNKKYGYDSASFDPRPSSILDDFLSEVCRTMDVVLMPGESDPTNATLPQQPINTIMLRQGSIFNGTTLKLATNPVYLLINNRILFGSSGQTVDDIAHYICTGPADQDMPGQNDDPEATDKLDIIESTLRWKHVAPTAPDTLWTYPYSDRDPFILEQAPDIYFLGNQASFDHRLTDICEVNGHKSKDKRCRIISIPKFAETGQLILLNLRTLGVEVITFDGSSQQ